MSALWDEIRTLDTGRKALRSFGLVVGAVFAVLAAVVWWRTGWVVGTSASVLGGLGGGLMLFGLMAPTLLRPLYRVWMGLALVLGFVMTRVLLTLVFALVVTPIGLIFRLLGKDPLHRRPDPEADTYWLPKPPRPEGKARFEKYY